MDGHRWQRTLDATTRIHRAGLAPDTWPEALKAIATALDGGKAVMFGVDLRAGVVSELRTHNIDGDATDRFAAYYHRLDRLDFGVVSLDQDGAILFMNRRAQRILASDDGLGVVNQRLVAAHRRDNDRLWALIRRTVVTRRDGGHDAGGSLAVARPSAGRPYAVNVAPGSGLASLVNAPATAALVLVTDPEDCPEPPAEHIARLHGLTPAEARVAAALAGGQSLREYADAAGLSIHTARSTLKQVFAKTDTRSQADLVRLLLTDRLAG